MCCSAAVAHLNVPAVCPFLMSFSMIASEILTPVKYVRPSFPGPARAMTTSSVWPRSCLMLVSLIFRVPVDESMKLTLEMSRPGSLTNSFAL